VAKLVTERISILLPCAAQKREFLQDALASVLNQTSSAWELLIGLDPAPRLWIRDFLLGYVDGERVRCVIAEKPNFAAVLNALMTSATGEFVAILLSDDRYAPEAVETLLRYRRKYPRADFFHSSRRDIDANGTAVSDVMKSGKFAIDQFKREGSPVKHLLCWRRELGLKIGGMNESLSVHGCDDYDFPWRMAEAGASFQAVDECLYEYRLHDQGPRLTTDVPLQLQVDALQRMFRSHGVGEADTCAYLQRAVSSYLVPEHLGGAWNDGRPTRPIARFREADAQAKSGFLERGVHERHFFPHRFYVLPRGGSDGMQLAQEMCNVSRAGALRQAALFANEDAASEFPASLFFDDDVVWHGQHLGLPCLVANANMVVDGSRLFVTQMLSDVVQRISRRRDHKTRIENRFKGWAHVLVNALAVFARDAGLDEVHFATSEFVIAHTDPKRTVGPELFDRVYDATVNERLRVRRAGRWWRAVVADNADRIAGLERKVEWLSHGKTICILHDTEAGAGHRGIDDVLADRADRTAGAALDEMLAIESALDVHASYDVLGVMLPGIRAKIEGGGHALAFHSYEHAVADAPSLVARVLSAIGKLAPRVFDPVGAARSGLDFRELVRCRQVDYRLKGYRPPMSRITPGLHDRHLAYFNFEWLASGVPSLGIEEPRMESGIVKIPIALDDFELYRGSTSYQEWERAALELADTRDFVAIGLHDCYAEHWLPHYREFLEKLCARGRLRTCDEVAAQTVLAASLWR
jgi:hypothetical protein